MGSSGARERDGIIVAPDAVHAEQGPGHLALPTSGEGPGVIVLDSGWGLTEGIRQLCERFSREGYVAYAPDLNEGRTALTEADVQRLAADLGFDLLVGLLLRAVDRLSEQPGLVGDHLGVIGCGLGGGRAMLLAELRPDRVGAVATFYGIEPDLHYNATRASFIGHFAADDLECPWSSVQAQLEQIRAAGREAEFYLYPGTHPGFFEEGRGESFDPEAAELAWTRTAEFFRDRLSRP